MSTRVCAVLVFLAVAPCSGRLMAPGAGTMQAANNLFLDNTALDKEMKHLAGILGVSNGTAKDPEPQAMTVEHASFTCKKLFAYKDSREVCLRLQPLLCGKDCNAMFPAGANASECVDVQKTICAIQKHSKEPEPVKLPGHSAPETVLTFCNAYPTLAVISIQHDKYYALKDPEPFLPEIKYLECKQAMIPAGEALNIFLGDFPAAKHVAGSDNAIIMIGQYKLGELKMGLTVYSFEDEGYLRPVICNGFPQATLDTEVAGKDWHPFVHAQHPKSLKYLECEKLNLDHADSQKDPEALEFSVDGHVVGHVPVSPVHTLYVVGTKRDKEKTIDFKEYSFDHGTLRETTE